MLKLRLMALTVLASMMLASPATTMAADSNADIKDYNIEMKFNSLYAAACPLWGAQDHQNYYRWHFAMYVDHTLLSLFKVENGVETFITNKWVSESGDYDYEYTLRIEVTGANHCKTYLDDVLVDERDGDFPYGELGFQAGSNMWNDGSDCWVNPETAWLDYVKMTASDGKVLFEDNFDFFSQDFSFGTFYGGLLYTFNTQADFFLPETYEVDKDVKGYSLETRMAIDYGKASILFAAQPDANGNYDPYNCYLWNLDYNGAILRTHILKDGVWEILEDVDVSAVVTDPDKFYDIRIDVSDDNKTAKTYIDNILVDTREGNFKYGNFGFRFTNAPGVQIARPQHTYYDDVKVTTPDGTVLFEEDFENPANVKFAGAGASFIDGKLMHSGHYTEQEVNVAKNFVWQTEGSAGIGSVVADKVVTDDVIYDLLGRRVENPAPGIYIQNGKKIAIR